MPALRTILHCGVEQCGGSIGYPSDRLFEEVAYIAFHFHWPHDQIMQFEHHERQHWVAEIASINRQLNDASAARSAEEWH